MSQSDDHQRQSQEAESSTESSNEVELASQSCNQKLIVVIAADEQHATKHWRVSEACKKPEADGPKRIRFSWIDRDVLMASLCYSMTGLIFIITGKRIRFIKLFVSSSQVFKRQNSAEMTMLWSYIFQSKQ